MEIYFKRKYVFSSAEQNICETSIQDKIDVRKESDTRIKDMFRIKKDLAQFSRILD